MLGWQGKSPCEVMFDMVYYKSVATIMLYTELKVC